MKSNQKFKKLNILFRVSGGRAIGKELGMGHVYRCINLAKQLNVNSINFAIEDYGGVIPVLKNHNFKNIFQLKNKIPIEEDIKEVKKIIQKNNIHILIIDKYDSSVKKLSKELRKAITTIVISDLRKIDYDADLIVNGFIGFKNNIIRNRFNSKCLIGPKYQILSKNYQTYQKKKKVGDIILATFGGFDENNISEIIYKEIMKIPNMNGKIITGPATNNQKLKKVFSQKQKRVQIISHVKNLKNLIQNTKFGICSGGITTYEFAALNVPFAIICQYKHQKQTAREWAKLDLAINLGFPNKNLSKKLARLLVKLSNNRCPKFNYKKIVDGLGTKRVVEEIMKLFIK